MTRRRRLALALALACAAAFPAAAQVEDPFRMPPPREDAKPRMVIALPMLGGEAAPGTAPSISAETITEIEKGVYRLEGYADVRYGPMRLQADRVTYDSVGKRAQADGNVVLEQGEGTLGADRLEMNLESGEATLWDVTGYMPPYYQFRADRLERIDAERFWLYGAVFTTCTQPTPYWAFKVKKAYIELEKYAHLHGAAFKTGKASIVYLPYLLWPVKRERVSGFLMPDIGSSSSRGAFLGLAYFWAIRRNMDATIYTDFYSIAGPAGGLEFRYLPDDRGKGQFTGYYLDSDVDPEQSRRYRFNYSADQPIGADWRLLIDLNQVSDGSYYQDFERDLGLAATPYEFSFADLSRSWSAYTLNVRAERREQYFGTDTLVQQRLPEAEIRSRSQRIGESPFYYSFLGSGARLQRRATGLDADYERLDAGATLNAAWSPTPWLDLNPSLSLRETYWTQQADPTAPGGVADEPLNRAIGGASLEILGPKFFRIFEPEPGSGGSRFKSTIEPSIVYQYIPAYDDRSRILLYDEIDNVFYDYNLVSYGVTSRLLRRKPIPRKEGEAADAPAEYEAASEIASVEIRQAAAFNQQLSRSLVTDRTSCSPNPFYPNNRFFDICDPVESSAFGPVTLAARYNPTIHIATDVRLDYDILYDSLRSLSVSGNALSDRYGRIGLSYYLARDPSGVQPSTGTVRLGGGSALFARRMTFNVDFAYDLPTHDLQSQRYQVGYQGQCCGFIAEYLNRDYAGLIEPTREFRFTVTLKGVGNFLDLRQRFN